MSTTTINEAKNKILGEVGTERRDNYEKELKNELSKKTTAKQHPIGWLNMPGYKPETWNPIVGCSKVSPGCDNCYAERMANRLSVALGAKGAEPSDAWIAYSDIITKGHWNGKTALVKSALNKPLKWKEPRMIFVCSMSDLFHESMPFETIERVFEEMWEYDQHIYVLLTKRPERALKFYQWVAENIVLTWRPKDNIWLGVTAENQEQADRRIPILLQIPAAKRFVSIEPMLGAIQFETRWFFPVPFDFDKRAVVSTKEVFENDLLAPMPGLDWVICGGETGPKSRPMHPDWVRSLRDQCKAAGVPFFFKQWGEWLPVSTVDGKQYLPFADYIPDTKFGYKRKKAQYKTDILDGQQYQEWPKPVS